jgi:hypothetical protein
MLEHIRPKPARDTGHILTVSGTILIVLEYAKKRETKIRVNQLKKLARNCKK